MWYEDLKPDDQVAASCGHRSSAAGKGCPAGALVGQEPQGLHKPPVIRRPRSQDVLQDRLPGHRPTPHRFRRPPERSRPFEGAPLLNTVLRGLSAAQKGEVVVLLLRATTSAADRGLIGKKPTAAVDGTGLESRHTSRYFFKRAGRKHSSRLWTKLTVAVDTKSHFLAGASVATGPSNDSPQLRPVMLLASLALTWDRVLADAAFDSEAHHRYCRENLGVRATVIPLNRRGQGRKWPKTKYRRQMVQRFRKKPRGSRHKRVYSQRWQAESAFSRHKRRLGSALGARSDASRTRECYLRVLTHNLMLLAATG